MGRRDTFLLSIFTLVTTFVWLSFDVYHASIDTTVPPSVEEQLAPINPVFDRKVIENLKSRQNVEPLAAELIQGEEPVAQPVPSTTSGGIETFATPSGLSL